MANGDLNWIANFIWGVADDVLRDLYVRSKYRDVILPMTVQRRLDTLFELTKQAVLDMRALLDKAGVIHRKQALRKLIELRADILALEKEPEGLVGGIVGGGLP